MDIITLIELYRGRGNLSVSKLADMVGVSSSTLSRILNRETDKLDYSLVIRLKNTLGILDSDMLLSFELTENKNLNNMEITEYDKNSEEQCNVCSKFYKNGIIKRLSLGHRNQTQSINLCESCRLDLINVLKDSVPNIHSV